MNSLTHFSIKLIFTFFIRLFKVMHLKMLVWILYRGMYITATMLKAYLKDRRPLTNDLQV